MSVFWGLVATTFHALKASLREKLRTFSKNKGGFVQKPTPFAQKSTVFERRLSAADEKTESVDKMHNTRLHCREGGFSLR
jgi:hypothetical protein